MVKQKKKKGKKKGKKRNKKGKIRFPCATISCATTNAARAHMHELAFVAVGPPAYLLRDNYKIACKSVTPRVFNERDM